MRSPFNRPHRALTRDELHAALIERARDGVSSFTPETERLLRRSRPSRRALLQAVDVEGLGGWYDYLCERATLCDLLRVRPVDVHDSHNADLVQEVIELARDDAEPTAVTQITMNLGGGCADE